MARKFFFVGSLSPSASARDRELQQASARKHAATVSHAKNRSQGRPSSSRLNYSKPVPRWESKVDGRVDPTYVENDWEDTNEVVLDETENPRRAKDQAYTTSGLQAKRSVPHPHLASLPRPQKAQVRFRHQKRRMSHDGIGGTKNTNFPHDTRDLVVKDIPENFQSAEEKAELEKMNKIWRRDLSNLVRKVNQVEPFYNSPHGNSSSFYRGAEYFTQVIIPNNAPVYTIFNVSNVYTQDTFDLSQKDHVLHAWLGTMHLIRSAIAPETSSNQDAWRHTGAALSKLRGAIADPNNPSDDYLVGTVLFLALLARAYGDLAGFEVHKTNLAILVKQRGGLDGLGYDGLLKACCLQWGSFWDLDGAQKIFPDGPIIEPPKYPESPISPSLRKKTSALPRGFELLASAYTLPIDLIEILSRIAEYQSPTKRTELSKQLNPAWQKRKNADFWEACSSLAIPGPDFNKFLCLTLLLYTANEFSPISRGVKGMQLYSAPRMLLMKQIQLLKPLVTEQIQRECWMWIWMVAIDSWSERTFITPVGEMLLLQFRQEFSEIETWTELDAVLSKFFYSESFRAASRAYWEYVPGARRVSV